MTRLRDVDLPADAFAVVMATGIVSEAARLNNYPIISQVLYVIAGVLFAVLAGGLGMRVALRPASARRELGDPDVALRLFTAVAACGVLATRSSGHLVAVLLLGAAGFAAWLLLVPLAVRDVRGRGRAQLRDHAHGAWLLPSVGTAGLVITAADIAARQRWSLLLVAGALGWILSVVIYVVVGWLIAWRAAAAPFVADLVTPDSWILMGALAIAGLASDHLLRAVDTTGLVEWLAGPLHTASLTAWILASLWIPILLYAEIWRADHTTGSLRFAGVWWSAVFPLAMYATVSSTTGTNLHLRQLATVSLVSFWVAATVWLMVALGAVHRAAARLAAPA